MYRYKTPKVKSKVIQVNIFNSLNVKCSWRGQTTKASKSPDETTLLTYNCILMILLPLNVAEILYGNFENYYFI